MGALRYASRLAATTSVVVAGFSIVILGSINIFLGLFGLLASALLGYIVYIACGALAEWISPAR